MTLAVCFPLSWLPLLPSDHSLGLCFTVFSLFHRLLRLFPRCHLGRLFLCSILARPFVPLLFDLLVVWLLPRVLLVVAPGSCLCCWRLINSCSDWWQRVASSPVPSMFQTYVLLCAECWKMLESTTISGNPQMGQMGEETAQTRTTCYSIW